MSLCVTPLLLSYLHNSKCGSVIASNASSLGRLILLAAPASQGAAPGLAAAFQGVGKPVARANAMKKFIRPARAEADAAKDADAPGLSRQN